MFNLFKNLITKPKTSEIQLSKQDFDVLNTALTEYLENRLYDIEGINLEDATNPQNLTRLSWFFQGLEAQKKITLLKG